MKITIVGGAGCVGSCSAFRLAQDGFASEIVLLDTRRNVATAHALDIEQAMVHRVNLRVKAGEITDTKDSDIIVIACADWDRPPVASRSLSLGGNVKLILMELLPALTAQSPSAFWIVVSAPLDVLIYMMHRIYSIPRKRVVGVNRNDTSRLRWAVAKVLSVPAKDVEAYVLGEHGETQVHLMSSVRVRGKAVSLDAGQREQVVKKIKDFLPEWNSLQPGRSAGWATAEAIGDMVTSMVSGDGRVWSCSTPLEGEYGLKDVSLGVPIRLDSGGVKEIVQLDLAPEERKGLQLSAETLRKQIKQGQAYIDEYIASMDQVSTFLKSRGKL